MRSESSNLLLRQDLAGLGSALASAWEQLLAWRRRRLGLRGSLVYVAALPLAPAAIIALASGSLGPAVAAMAALLLAILGGRLNRRGMLERLVAPERRYTRATRIPHQYAAVLLVAAATAVAAYGVAGHDLLVSAIFALLASVGFHLAYRLPSLSTLTGEVPDEVTDAPSRRALRNAEEQLLAIERAALEVGNRELEQRLRRVAAQGRAILDLLAKRPTELFRARQFLNVYLEGAERVARRYVRTHRLARGRELESNFRNVLTQIESAFSRQHQRLLSHDALDLDVQIEVLRKQLQREGIA
jgi:hypothetical protein